MVGCKLGLWIICMWFKYFVKNSRYLLEAITAYTIFAVFRLLPIQLVSGIGGRVATCIGPLTSAHRVGQNNLLAAFPELVDSERAEILRKTWDNFGRVMAEYAALSRLGRLSKNGRVEVCGIENISKIIADRGPAIIISGHLGNWELAGLISSAIIKPDAVVYRSPNNPFIVDLLRALRGLPKNSLVPKGQYGARAVVKALNAKGFVGLVVDQKMNTGRAIPFFGRKAMTGSAVARLALKYSCPIIPVRSQRLNGCRFKIIFEKPWTPKSSGNLIADEYSILEHVNGILERWIRSTPEQWLWLHNRWPKDKSCDE